jgi:NhaP-type Na+/H+ or K+/H+ antiporter
VTTDQIFLGVGLTVVLAVGSQILASRLRIPALIVLLPVGFVAGALTDTIHPDALLGNAFSPLVTLAVSVILYDAGLSLDLRKLAGHRRRVVVRLIGFGVPITWVLAAIAAALFLRMPRDSALMLGAILIVSGPTVVGPLLDFVRPSERVHRILAWEGSLIDPVGAILGAVTFNAIVAHQRPGAHGPTVDFLVSVGVGLLGGAVGVALLWLLLRRLDLGEELGTIAQFAAVIGVCAVCNVVRDDTGLIAAIVMGMAAANLPGFDIPARRPFFETLVKLILGLLFISISATVTPASLRNIVWPTLALVAVLVFLARPLIAALATIRTDLTRPERMFLGWMAPRGIVAAATASTFATTLVAKGVGGASRILPATFLVIVATVTLYGLTAAPVARRLGVTRPAGTRPLLVGGAPWVVDLALALKRCGLDVLMWAGLEQERERIRQAGLTLAPGELLAVAARGAAELEGITAVLLLTEEDDFNALGSTMLETMVDGSVYRLAPPRRSHGVIAPYTGGQVLFDSAVNRSTVDRRFAEGERFVTRGGEDGLDGGDLLFVIRADGRLDPVTRSNRPERHPGDVAVLLGRDEAGSVR